MLKTFIATGVVACALVFTSISFQAKAESAVDRPPSVDTLLPNERLEIDYSSRGCFSGEMAQFVITRQAAIVRRGGRGNILEDSLVLSAHDVRAFDSYLAYAYANDNRGGCTTVDKLTIRIMHGQEKITSYDLTDATCGGIFQRLFPEQEGQPVSKPLILTPRDLLKRLK